MWSHELLGVVLNSFLFFFCFPQHFYSTSPSFQDGSTDKPKSHILKMTGLDFLAWSLTYCYKNDHKDEVIDEDAQSCSSDEADMKIHINDIHFVQHLRALFSCI